MQLTFSSLTATAHWCLLPVHNSLRSCGCLAVLLCFIVSVYWCISETALRYKSSLIFSQTTFVAQRSFCRAPCLRVQRRSFTNKHSFSKGVSSPPLFHPFIQSLCVESQRQGRCERAVCVACFTRSVFTAECWCIRSDGVRFLKAKFWFYFLPALHSPRMALYLCDLFST